MLYTGQGYISCRLAEGPPTHRDPSTTSPYLLSLFVFFCFFFFKRKHNIKEKQCWPSILLEGGLARADVLEKFGLR
jgi:hypothetical protein